MVSTVIFGGVFMSTAGSTVPTTGSGGLAPVRQRRDLVAGLDLVDRVVVGRSVGLGAADDPDIGRRRVDANDARRQRAGPARRRHGEIAGLGSGRAPAGRGEHVGPHVEHRQQVIAPVRIGHRDDHRLLRQIEPGAGIERVEVRPHHHLHVRRRDMPATLANVFAGAEIPSGLATLVSCFRVTSIVTSG